MGYRGSVEYICVEGHYYEEDGSSYFEDRALRCPVCGERWAYYHRVDYTNGSGPEYGADTMPAPLKEIGYTDIWRVDHYGNRYATKLFRYGPAKVHEGEPVNSYEAGDRWQRYRYQELET